MQNIYYTYVYLDPRKRSNTTLQCCDLSLLFEPFYVGKGSGKRLFTHLTDRTSKNKLKTDKIKRIRNNNQEPIIIKICEDVSEEFALKMEQMLISEIGTKWIIKGVKRGPLTNQTSGGEGHHLSEKLKYEISVNMTGSNNPMYGKPRSEEVKEKLRAFRKTFKHSELTKQKMREKRANGKSGNHKKWIIENETGEKIKTENLKKWCADNNISYNTIFNSFKRQGFIKSGTGKGFRLIEDLL